MNYKYLLIVARRAIAVHYDFEWPAGPTQESYTTVNSTKEAYRVCKIFKYRPKWYIRKLFNNKTGNWRKI